MEGKNTQHWNKLSIIVCLLRSVFIGCYLHGDIKKTIFHDLQICCCHVINDAVDESSGIMPQHQAVQSIKERSLFAFNHDDVVTKLCFHRRISVYRFIHSADGKCKRGILKWSHHWSSRHPAKVTLSYAKKNFKLYKLELR